jgi:hypothetical protein
LGREIGTPPPPGEEVNRGARSAPSPMTMSTSAELCSGAQEEELCPLLCCVGKRKTTSPSWTRCSPVSGGHSPRRDGRIADVELHGWVQGEELRPLLCCAGKRRMSPSLTRCSPCREERSPRRRPDRRARSTGRSHRRSPVVVAARGRRV